MINSAFGALAFEFPYAFKLSNHKIFVIHKKGISITNAAFTSIERRELTFVGSERVTTDEDYTKITHAMEQGEHIVCIVKDIIYVFDNEGNFLQKSTTTITDDPVKYYDLTITKESHGFWSSKNDYTLFTIGYVWGGKYHFLKYYYYSYYNKIELQSHLNAQDENNYEMGNTALSCKYMYYLGGLGSQLVCLYYAEGKGIGVHKYEKIDQSENENQLQNEAQLYYPTEDRVIYIKSTQIDSKNILVGWVTEKGIPYYSYYNIHFNDEIITTEQECFSNIKCQMKPQFFKFNYYTIKDENGEALFTCLMERNIIPEKPLADIYLGYFYSFSQSGDYNYYTTSENYFYENCTIHGYSIVFLETIKDFYVISDAVCSGKQQPIYRLFGDMTEEELATPATEAPAEEDLKYDACKCPDELCELDMTCTNDGDCKDQSYYGNKCDQLCEAINPLCIKCSRDGKCLECSDKHYFGATCEKLCDKCPDDTCDVNGICLDVTSDCEDQKYYGDKCNIQCINEFCLTCNRNGKCLECKDNKYSGDTCEHECKNCPGGTCNINEGKCINQDENCLDQLYYGEECETSCDYLYPFCYLCERDGTCIQCKDKFHFGTHCGDLCDKCPDAKCDISGNCEDETSNCKNNIVYGTKCDKECDSKCNKCNRDGTCIACSDNHNWGSNCDKQCSNCPGGTCDINGICLDHDLKCEDKIHYGEKCDLECDSKCAECNRQGECTSCKSNQNWGSKCEDTCPNCPDQTCQFDGDCENQSAEYCGNSAFYGTKCSMKCSDAHSNCLKCKKESGDCVECSGSFFGTDCGQECTNCPEGKCDINGICTDQDSNCVDNLSYGTKCDKACDEKCEKCNREGKCTSCKDNHYFTNTCSILCQNCPDGTCDIEGICVDQSSNCANVEYYGEKCDELCISLNENCIECNRDKTCISCKENKYHGSSCDTACGNCPGGTCNIDGACLNNEGDFCAGEATYGSDCSINCSQDRENCLKCYKASGNCFECQQGYYGINCDSQCNNCPENKCDIEGKCTGLGEECTDNKFTGTFCNTACSATISNCLECTREPKCTKCKTSFYGDQCSDKCEYCPDQLCDMTGVCTVSETDCVDLHYKGASCKDHCDDTGNENCDECHRNGSCTKCKENKFYGTHCENSCSKCPDGLCSIDGKCSNLVDNCLNNLYYGDNCDISCSQISEDCQACDRNGICLKCKNKLTFGESCQNSCEKCPEGTCEIEGTCTYEGNCKDNDYFGDKCDNSCSAISSYCKKCTRDKKCIESTDEYHYGEECDKTCDNCPGKKCSINGVCKDENSVCEDKVHYGTKCDEECDIKCGECNRDGVCTSCQLNKFWTSGCDQSCENCPEGTCNFNNGECIVQTSNCKDNDFYGKKCDQECSKIDEHCEKCNHDGTCISCSDNKYTGSYCKETCPRCPGGTCDVNGVCINQDLKCEDKIHYGEKCDLECNANCAECNRQGKCTSCVGNKFWGTACDKPCGSCPGGTCNFEDGTCIEESELCGDGTNYGESCDIPCQGETRPNCLKCFKETGNCFECQGSYYGNNCEQQCNNCPEGKCTIKGICNGEGETCANNQFTGEKCNILCNIAIDSKCEECTYGDNPKCTKCESPFYGDTCSDKCDKCPNSECDNNGICSNKNDLCEDKEYTGEKCSSSCSEVISNCKECTRDNKCTKCVPPFYKDDCSQKCENCPNGECDINGICIDSSTDCENKGYKGPSCETPCNNEGQENCEKCHRNGECFQDDIKEPTTKIDSTQGNEDDKTQENEEKTYSSEVVNQCLSLINFESIENSNTNISSSKSNNVGLNAECKEFYKTNQIVEGKGSYSFLIGPTNGNEKSNIDSSNTNSNANSTFSSIDLGKCEDILKEENGIDKNKSLLILISEKLSSNATERNTQFEVYNPDTFEKLNLSVCEDEPIITVSTPIELTDELLEIKEAYEELQKSGYNLFDKNDKFYTDICTPYTSKDKTDIPLSDRFNDFYLNSEIKCSSGCEFDGYNFETNSLNCKCNVITSDIDLSKLRVGQDEGKEALYRSFVDVLKFSNYKVLRCYNLAFNAEIFSYNIGTYLVMAYFLLYFISFFIVLKKGLEPVISHIPKDLLEFNYNTLKNDIHKTLNNEKTFNLNTENMGIDNEEKIKQNKRNSIRKNTKKKSRRKSSRKTLNIPQNSTNNNSAPPKKHFIKEEKKRKSIKNNLVISAKHKKSDDQDLVDNIKFHRKSTFAKRKTAIEFNEKAQHQDIKYDDFELNNMEYEEAMECDHRPFTSVYLSLLKREHLLIFSFCTRNDYNLTFVKFCRLFFLIATDMCLNVFFFFDETMHTMYLDYGKYNFIQNVPQIIYTTIVSQILDVFLCYLSLTDKAYYEIKNLKAKDRFELLKIIKCMKIKLTIFYILTFTLFAFHWYTITCFCAVYRNTQSAFIKNSLSSFGMGQLYPFVLYLFPSAFRIMSLSYCKSGCVYKFSDIIPFF